MSKLLHRSIPIEHERLAASGAPASRIVELVFTTGAPVSRFDWMTGQRYQEELSLDPKHVRLDRLNAGAPLLAAHAQSLDAQLGVVESADVGNGRGSATVRFAQTPEGDRALQLVRDRILRNVSVGYAVHRWEKTEATDGGQATWRAVDWEPMEISLVSIGADPGAQIRGEAQLMERAFNPQQTERTEMKQPKETDTEYTTRMGQSRNGVERSNEILQRGLKAGLDHAFVQRMVESDLALEDVCMRMVDEVARKRESPAILAVRANEGAAETTSRDLMAEMLVARVGGGSPSEPAQRYRNHRMVDMARELLELRGERTTGMTASELISRSLNSTSDFPYLLENVANKVLLKGYNAYASGIKVACRRVLARDFKPLSRLQFGEAPTLAKVLEDGEFQGGKMLEQKNTYSVETFGRIFYISRQALVNDDLDAFGQVAVKFGRMAAEFEHGQLATLLTSNPNMGDAVALFHASHGNLQTGTGSALSETSLATAKKDMRLQKGLNATTPIDAAPRWLIVPAALEITAQKLLATITATKSSDVNPFGGALDLIVDPRLDSNSATAWYLAGDTAVIDTIEYANLEDAPGPVIETKAGFEVDGIQIKVREDFGCGVVEHRGLYKANGV